MRLKNRRGWRRVFLVGFVLCFFAIFIKGDGTEKSSGISLNVDMAAAGQPVFFTAANLKSSEVESCVWFVGERETARSDKLFSYVPSQEDSENFIRVIVTLKDGTQYEDSLYYSVLPVIYMESNTNYESVTKDTDVAVYMKLTANQNCRSTETYDGRATIHMRGNGSSENEKIPFKVKLEEKANLLGLGETKHWVLLANAIDATLMRNKLVSEFSGDIGADCWMDSENVTLIYNGVYQGVYQLCEHVRIGENSISVYDWQKPAEEAAKEIAGELIYQKLAKPAERPILEAFLEMDLTSDFSWMNTHCLVSPALADWNQREGRNFPTKISLEEYIHFDTLPEATGGVLLEMDYYHNSTASLKTSYLQPFYYNTPEYGDTYQELHSYIRESVQALEYAFHDTDFTYHNMSPHYKAAEKGWFDWENEKKWVDTQYQEFSFFSEKYDGVHYSELIDFDSLMVNFLVCEFAVNWDSMKNSVFLYKDIDGPFYIGPAWDYDWAWGNSNYAIDTWIPEEWHTTNDFFTNEQYYQSVQWNRYLIRDPYFLVRIYEKYWEIRGTVIEDMIREGGRIDQYADQIRRAAEANDERWGGSMGSCEGQKFEEALTVMKAFVEQRVCWLDKQFSSVEALRLSLGYYITSDSIEVARTDKNFLEGAAEVSICTENPDYAGVSLQVNGVYFYTGAFADGKAVVQIPDSALRTEEGALNTVQVRALDENGDYIINPEGTIEGDYFNAVSNYICFTKDLESR